MIYPLEQFNSINNESPKVTVLMCVYNDEQFVSEAIESILCQTFENFEFVIINDGSTDKTPQILNVYAQKDKRVTIHTQENCGTTIAANYGLSIAKGVYVARIDSDDISLPYRLEKEVEFLDSHPEIVLIGGGTYIIDMKGNIIGSRNVRSRNLKKTLLSRCIYQQSDVMFHREIAVQLGGYREKFRNAQDYDLWLRIADVGEIAKLDMMLGMWRANPSGYTLSRKEEQEFEHRIALRFAWERKKVGFDSYDEMIAYMPQTHRKPTQASFYNEWVGGLLLQSLHREDARNKLCEAITETFSIRTFILWLATYLPLLFLKVIRSVREIYLNYR